MHTWYVTNYKARVQNSNFADVMLRDGARGDVAALEAYCGIVAHGTVLEWRHCGELTSRVMLQHTVWKARSYPDSASNSS